MTDISDCISFLAAAAAKSMGRLARDRLSPYQITPVQYAVMRSLLERPARTGSEVSAQLLIDSATMTGLIDRLERLKLVGRRLDATDRRINRLELTAAGLALMPELDRQIQAVNAEADRRLGPDAARLRCALRRLIDNTGTGRE
jgi:DNA-binding MarR family transcriptional regulator